MARDEKDRRTLDIEAYAYGQRFAEITYATKLPLGYVREEWLKDGDIHIVVSAHFPHPQTAGRLSISDAGKLCLDGVPKSDKHYSHVLLYPAPRDADDWEAAEWGDETDQGALAKTAGAA